MLRTVFVLGITIGLVFACAPRANAQTEESDGETWQQRSADAYTRYELLDPASQSFRIVYDVTAVTPGATHYYNPIRKGSEPTVHSVTDLRTGKALAWKLISGKQATRLAGADPEGQYIEVELARPVPQGVGEQRIRIDKTYRDKASYTQDGDRIVFERSLGIPRNSVVLPVGYELTGCSMPSQVELVAARTGDGERVKLSFLNRNPGAAPLRVEARKLAQRAHESSASATSSATGQIEERPPSTRQVPTSARLGYRWRERAFQDREIVYFLQQPETHSFRLYHDYTEFRPGMDRYLNVVRPGSRASNPSALMLDTGETLKVETLRGQEISKRGIDPGEPITDEMEVVVIWFDPVKPGHSARLRIEETYTDPGRYGKDGDELVWDRSFGRAKNTVLLPEGWWLTASSVPAVIDLSDDGRTRLLFVNDRDDGIDVYLRARRR